MGRNCQLNNNVPRCVFWSLVTEIELGKGVYQKRITTRSGREYGSFSSINSMAMPSMDDLIRLMVTEGKAKRERNQPRFEMAEMKQQRVVELRALGDIMATLRPMDRARDTPRLQRMMEGEDVESFLATFERVM